MVFLSLLVCTVSLRVNSYCLVTKSCLTLCDPVDCSPPGSSVQGIFQASILERVAISFFTRTQQLFPIHSEYIFLIHPGNFLLPKIGWPPKFLVFYANLQVFKYQLLVSQVANSHSLLRCLQSLVLILISCLGCWPQLFWDAIGTGLPCTGGNCGYMGRVAAPGLL